MQLSIICTERSYACLFRSQCEEVLKELFRSKSELESIQAEYAQVSQRLQAEEFERNQVGKKEWEIMQENLGRVKQELQSEEEKLHMYRIKAQEHEVLKQQV